MKERKGEHPFGDAGQLILLAMFLVVWVSDTFYFHWSTFLADWIPHSIRMGLLYALLVMAAILLWTGRFVIMGKERPDYVVDSGPFHYVRHPLYLAALLAYIGTVISSFSLFSLALLIPILVFYNYIASYEEKLLEAKFGEPYKDYEKRTGKWLPKLRRKSA
jgi:protein-S-isoprenylcysteine O-methyltransferase Ste14